MTESSVQPQTPSLPIDPDRISHRDGLCWVVRDLLPGGDASGDHYRSRVRLWEDDRCLGAGHSGHESIRTLGRGRFSHWGDSLYFSTSDNSDPRTNGRSYRIEIVPEGIEIVDMPTTMHIAVTSACNLTCRICRPEGPFHAATLSDTAIERLISGAFPTLRELRLDSGGEPTLHRAKFRRLVSAATEHGVAVFVCTNAALMDRELADFICASSMYKVQISMDSANNERLEWVRRGAKAGEVTRGVRELVAARAASGRTDLRIALHAALLRNNVDDLPDLVRFAHENGVEEVSCMFGFIHDFMDPEWSVFWDKAHHNAVIDEATQVAAELGVRLQTWGRFNPAESPAEAPTQPERKAPRPCNYLYQWTYVNPSGLVAPCCISPNCTLGNLESQAFEAIWRGDVYEELRRTHNTPTPSNPKCAACYLTSGWNKESYHAFFAPTHWPAVRARLGLPAE